MMTKSISKHQPNMQTEKSETQCLHRWQIQPSDGRISNGTCIKCGKTREFVDQGLSAEL